ncbi:MAG: hypothetical protein ABI591_00240, partial [Kofleriaceae bacterium]
CREVVAHQLLDLGLQMLDTFCGHAPKSHEAITRSTPPLNGYVQSPWICRATSGAHASINRPSIDILAFDRILFGSGISAPTSTGSR